MSASFTDYLVAIDRKLEIAHFHSAELTGFLQAERPGAGGMPPVPIQAHFEGVLRCPIAMFDQIVAGVADIVPDMPAPHAATTNHLVKRLRNRTDDQPAADLADLIETWRQDTRLCDARSVRNRATHMHYDKSPDQAGWLVEDPRYLPPHCDAWLGDRHLDTYTEMLVTIAIAISSSASLAADLAEALAADT